MHEEKSAEIRRPESLKSELLRLVERAGHHLGLTRTLNYHLRYLIRHTAEADWHGHNRAVVYKSVNLMARECAVSERQIYNREQLLVETLGLFITGAGGRRYGQRDKSGQLVRAFGIDLTNLHGLLPTLRKAAKDAEADLAQWRDHKATLSELRRTIRKLTEAALSHGLTEVLAEIGGMIQRIPDRIHARVSTYSLEQHVRLARQIRVMLEQALLGITCGERVNSSDTSEVLCRRKDTLRDSKADSVESDCSGLWIVSSPNLSTDSVDNHDAPQGVMTDESSDPALSRPVDKGLSLDRVVGAASGQFIDSLPYGPERLTEAAVIETAEALLPDLGISQAVWTEACYILGSWSAAVCVVLADRRTRDGHVRNPGGYVRAMTRRALTGDLRLSASVWGTVTHNGGRYA